MKEFWFIRHGQSETNVGLPSDSDQSTPLTEIGSDQAKFVPDAISERPDLFVVSPYVRTSQTALHTLEKFPAVPVETWPIQEFTYLSYTQYAGTTTRDRRRLSISYFREGNPDLVLGDGGESFNHFIARVEGCFQRIVESPHKRVVLFGHGWFMRAGLWVLLKNAVSSHEKATIQLRIKEQLHVSPLPMGLYNFRKSKSDMRSFLLFSAAVETPNCSILKYQTDEDSRKINLSGFEVSHLPRKYLRTTLRNR
jgi:broad specificity phosphatase PhoE